MWKLIYYYNDNKTQLDFSSKGAAFARLKMLFPTPENMYSYAGEDYVDFRFVNPDGSKVSGYIVKNNDEDDGDDGEYHDEHP